MNAYQELMKLSETSACLHITEADSFGEAGMDQPRISVLLANWNGVGDSLKDCLIEEGCLLEYDDEYIICGENKAYGIYPTHAGWRPSYIIVDGEVIGKSSVIENGVLIEGSNLQSYKAAIIIDSYNIEGIIVEGIKVDSFNIPLELLGFNMIYEGETGLHAGMNDDPIKTLESYRELVLEQDLELIFKLVESSQFYIEWELWVRQA